MAPKFAQAPRVGRASYVDETFETLVEGDIAAGVHVDMIRAYMNATGDATHLSVYLTQDETVPGGLVGGLFDLIPLVADDFVTKRYDCLVVPNGWYLRCNAVGLSAGGVSAVVLGGELG